MELTLPLYVLTHATAQFYKEDLSSLTLHLKRKGEDELDLKHTITLYNQDPNIIQALLLVLPETTEIIIEDNQES